MPDKIAAPPEKLSTIKTLESTLTDTAAPSPDTPSDDLPSQKQDETSNILKTQEKKKSLLSRITAIDPPSSPSKASSAFDSNSDGYVSAREAINALDKEVSVDSLSEEELIAQKIHTQLQVEADYFVFRFKKSRTLLTLGGVVLALWLLPLTLFLNNKYDLRLFSFLNSSQKDISSPSPSPQVILSTVPAQSFPVLIKGSARSEIVGKIISFLKASQYTVQIEEAEVLEKEISIVFQNPTEAAAKELLGLLSQNYDATISAVVLSSDSNFKAVIFVPSK